MMKIFVYIGIVLTIAACSSVPRFTSKDNLHEEAIVETDSLTTSYSNPPADSILATETGIASYYAEPFHGRKTANGQIYDMYALTAAHPTFPLGTIAKVTNLKNGKSVILTINDRMPKHPQRIVDLSLGVAKKLDMVNDGLARVRIDILKWGDNKYYSP